MSNIIDQEAIEREVIVDILCEQGDNYEKFHHFNLSVILKMTSDPIFDKLTYKDKVEILHRNYIMLGDDFVLSNGSVIKRFDKENYDFQEAALTDEFGLYKLSRLLHFVGKIKIHRDIIVNFITSNTLSEEDLSFSSVINHYSKEDKLYIINKVYGVSVELGLKYFSPISSHKKNQILFQPNIAVSYDRGRKAYERIFKKIIANEQDIVDENNILKIKRFINSYINITPEMNKQNIIDIIATIPSILWDNQFSSYLSLQYPPKEMTNIFSRATIKNLFVLYQNYTNPIYDIDDWASEEVIEQDPAAEIYIDLLKYGQEKNGNALIYNNA